MLHPRRARANTSDGPPTDARRSSVGRHEALQLLIEVLRHDERRQQRALIFPDHEKRASGATSYVRGTFALKRGVSGEWIAFVARGA